MDGSQESDRPPVGDPAQPPAAPRVKVLRCSGCGNSLTVRGVAHTESIACEACGSVIDLTDENLRILCTYQSKIKYTPLIPLGARGKMKGDLFEVIGFMRRAMTVEGVKYEWSEYLLFNPYKGFRWLSEYNGHWSFLKATTNIPKLRKKMGRGIAKYLDRDFLQFQTYQANVVYVIGEFYWKVQAGESCGVTDYVSPPFILSEEQTEKEVVWTIGEYVEPAALWSAFSLKTAPPPRVGVAPNQPSPYKSQSSEIFHIFGYLCLAAFIIHLGLTLLAQNKMVYENHFQFRQADREKSLVTDFFSLTGHASNVMVRSKADVNNSWIYLHMALINEEGQAYDFGREVSYYHGVDGGESWSEGGTSDEAILPSIPPGRYYLRIEPESSSPLVNYTVQVYRDVPRWSFFLVALGILCLVPILAWWRSTRFEAARWSEGN